MNYLTKEVKPCGYRNDEYIISDGLTINLYEINSVEILPVLNMVRITLVSGTVFFLVHNTPEAILFLEEWDEYEY